MGTSWVALAVGAILASSAENGRQAFVIGMRLSLPNARSLILTPGGINRR